MRRFFFGFLWFLVFQFGVPIVVLGFMGALAGQEAVEAAAKPPITFSEGYDIGYDAGFSVGEEFGRQYGGVIFLGSLALSIGGSALGILPGTTPKRAKPAPRV